MLIDLHGSKPCNYEMTKIAGRNNNAETLAPMTPDTEPDAIPYAAEGQRAFDAYVPELNPRNFDDCATDPMPRVLWTPDPMEIREEDGKHVFHYERGGIVRHIVMDGIPPAANQPNTRLGYSVGRWEGDVLIIETKHISGGIVSGNARPLSPDGRVTEGYWREPGSNDLQMELEIDERVEAFLSRRIEGEWPYLWVDATYLKTRQAEQIVSVDDQLRERFPKLAAMMDDAVADV